jgi:hypothetical protein
VCFFDTIGKGFEATDSHGALLIKSKAFGVADTNGALLIEDDVLDVTVTDSEGLLVGANSPDLVDVVSIAGAIVDRQDIHHIGPSQRLKIEVRIG